MLLVGPARVEGGRAEGDEPEENDEDHRPAAVAEDVHELVHAGENEEVARL